MPHQRYATLVLVGLLSFGCGGGDSVGPPQTFSASIEGEGSGTGRIQATEGHAFSCLVGAGSRCQVPIEDGTQLRFEASVGSHSSFGGWKADAASCGAVTSCSLTVDRALTLRARFDVELDGAWAGMIQNTNGATMTLTLNETAGAVTGSGNVSGSVAEAVTASGTYSPPSLSLTVHSPRFQDMNLTATVGATTMTGTLNGSGFVNSAITLNRQ